MLPRAKDPTRTLTLRNLAVSRINGRFNEIKRVIRQTVIENDVLTNAEPAYKRRFTFLRDSEKVPEFMAWLHTQIETEILAVTPSGNAPEPKAHWLNLFVGASYARGATKTHNAVARRYAAVGLPTTSVLTHPAHIERAELIFARVYSDLKGVTDTMEAQMARVLTDGIIQGQGIDQIARNLNNRVDKIGKVRARLIARTEIINAHNLAAIREAETLEELVGETIFMKWRALLDLVVRDQHAAWNGVVMTKEQAAARVGEPNCRCSTSAWTKTFGEL